MIFCKKIASSFIKFLTYFVPSKKLRKKMRDSFIMESPNSTFSKYMKHSHYGKIYLPTYNRLTTQTNEEHLAFNAQGEPLRTFFIRDNHFSHFPHSSSKYFLWDRFNFGLDVHFYTHNCMLELMGSPKKRYGMFIESESIVPADYEIFNRNKGLSKEFDLIFTYSEKILDSCENARILPACAGFWYGQGSEGGLLSVEAYKSKTKNISMLSSHKSMCDLHNFRISLAQKCKQFALADTFGTFDGGQRISLEEFLKDYRYSIIVENQVTPYYFTEKITNCFASMTIPVYLGAGKIDEFFNPDGIIKIALDDYDNIEKILQQCTEEEYLARLDAVKDNYNRVQAFSNMNDYMFEKFLKDDLNT